MDSKHLPEGWDVKRFGEITLLNRGQNPPKSDFIYKPQEGYIRFYQIRDGKNDDYEVYVPDTPQLHRVEPDEILMVAYRHIGKVFRGAKGAFNVALCKITNKDRSVIDDDYLFYIIPTDFVRGELMKQAERSLIPSMSVKHLAEIKIPVPPLDEQKRIVAILDEAFEGIDQAIRNTEKNLANARELFRSQLQSVFTNRDGRGIEMTLGDICQFENGDRGKNYPNREEYVELGIPWINTGHIQPDGTLSRTEMNFITREKYETLRSGKIRPGDLVYCLRGATIGKTALVDPLTIGAVASSLVIIRPNSKLDKHFLYYFLISSVGQKQIKLYDNGAAQPNLGAKSVAKYFIYLPNLAEQKVIVKNISSLAVETQKLETIYRQKLAALNELKQSILQKAFTGQLT